MFTVKCSLWKRFLAFFTDLLIVLFVGWLINMLIVTPIAVNVCHVNNYQLDLGYYQVQTNLYYIVDKDYEIVADANSNYKDIIKYSNQPNDYFLAPANGLNIVDDKKYNLDFCTDSIVKFFNKLDKNSFVESYVGEALGKYENGNYYLLDMSDEKKISFINDVYDNLPKFYNYYEDGIILELMSNIMISSLVMMIISYGIPTFINCIILPMILKYRQTIGKLIFSIAVVNTNFIRANRFVMLGRGLFLIVIEILLGILTFGTIFVVTFVSSLITKDGKSLHDIACRTIVIDLKDFEPFNDKNEFVDYVENEKDFRNKSLRRPYET